MNQTPLSAANPEMPEDLFRALCLRYHAGEISASDFEALSAELDRDAGRRAMFVESAMQVESMHQVFAHEAAEQTALEFGIAEEDDDFAIMSGVVESALAERRRHELEAEANRKLAAQQAEDERNRRFAMRRLADSKAEKRVVVIPKTAGWLGIAAVLGLLATLITLLNPAPPTPSSTTNYRQAPGASLAPVYATLIRSLDARWDDPATAWNGSNGLRKGMHRLAEGLVEIELAGGTRVVLEGPVSFELTKTNAMELIDGRLVATVPPSGCGFTVDTPTARITDHGTEYGVHADGHTQTQILVFRGAVRAAARVEGVVVGEAVALEANEAATIDVGGTSIARLAFDTTSFERRVAKRLDLVDIVAGGDGTGDASGRGISYRNGQAVEHASMAVRNDLAWIIVGYVAPSPVRSRPMIDSVFVIDRRSGSAVLDSGGMTFDRFPRTAAGVTFTDYFGFGFVQAIEDGNVVMPVKDRGHIDQPFATVGRPDLDGRAVVLHGGGGITFDLNQVARQHSGTTPTRFSAYALNAEAINQASKQTTDSARLDIWVLVDGQPRYEAKAVRTANGVIDITIDLRPGDRFLSLACSDAGDSIAHDWLVLAQPTLELAPLAGDD